MGHQVIVV